MRLVKLEYRWWQDNYAGVCRTVLAHGLARGSREGEVLELGPSTLMAKHPQYWVATKGRGGKRAFAEVEQLCYLAGVDQGPYLVGLGIAPSFKRFQEENGTWWGSYGPRLELQLQHVVTELRRHPDSRRAVTAIWSYKDLWRTMLDVPSVPCTLTMAFWRQDELVHCHVTMRSCDVWFGLYYDLPAFTMFQEAICWGLGGPTKPGWLWLTTTSLHLYAQHWVRAEGVVGSRVDVGRAGKGLPVRLSSEWPREESPRRIDMLARWARGRLAMLGAGPETQESPSDK